MNYYQRHIGDYAKKAGRLSMVEHGAYTLLMDACYDRERFPTRDEAIEWTWARSAEEIAAVDFVLSRFFTLTDGCYVQARIAEELAAYQAKCETNRAIAVNREATRRASAGKNKHDTSTTRAPAVNESPPNQEPRTKNQEPTPKGEKKEGAPVGGPPGEAGQGGEDATPEKPKRPMTKPEIRVWALALPLPDGIPAEAWAKWVDHRTTINKPVTKLALEQCIEQLLEYAKQGHAPADVVRHSSAGGFTGLYPPPGPGRSMGGRQQGRLANGNGNGIDDWLSAQSDDERTIDA